jgi:cysteinyl-tRNA synthetase
MLRIYNTLTRKKETFRPIDGKSVRMFVCGPTVYDLSHIGHGRTFLTFDLVARVLRKEGFRVRYLQNITDLDDKILERARRVGRPWHAIAKEFERAYLEDIARLGITSVDRFERATDFIPEIIHQIKRLLRLGYAYETPSGVYFHVPAFRRYGKLSHRRLEELGEVSRIDPDPTKRHPADFAIWKRAKEGEPSWESPWGRGRPGWHIEDTAITEAIFGPQYDIHGGAIDLIFPHHESEIALMESISGKRPFVRYWMHAGFLTVHNEKMAKSLGNFITIRELLDSWPAEVFRLFVFSAHYRSPLDYDEDLLANAAGAHQRLLTFTERLGVRLNKKRRESPTPTSPIGKVVSEARRTFHEALRDDFDTPRALGALFTLIRKTNAAVERNNLTREDRDAIASFLADVNDIFELIPRTFSPLEKLPPSIEKLVNRREALRKEKRFNEADAIREELREHGWILEDTPRGPRVKRQ